MYHGMHAEFVAQRSDSSVSGHFNVLNANFFPTVPLNVENMPPMNPANLYSDGSQYNPDDPFNPEADVLELEFDHWNPFANDVNT